MKSINMNIEFESLELDMHTGWRLNTSEIDTGWDVHIEDVNNVRLKTFQQIQTIGKHNELKLIATDPK